MPTILKTKNSVTTTVVPTTLQQGELAVNITDKKMWVGNAATTPVQLLGGGVTGDVVGPASATDNALARFDGTTGKIIQNSVVTIADTTGNMAGVGTISSGAITSSSLTSGRVTYAGTAGLLQDDADLTFDGTTLTTLNTAYTGTLTGGTGVVNLGSGQFYKDASGKVCIGTTTPQGTSQLTVVGSAYINNTQITDVAIEINGGGTGNRNAYIDFHSDDTYTDYGLRIIKSLGANATANIAVRGTGGLQLTAEDSPAPIVFIAGGGERMRITSTGNVGIGTSSIATKLDIRGTSATTDSTIQIVGNAISSLLLGQNANGGVIRGQGGNDALSFWTGGSGDTAASGSGTECMRIDSSGNLLVGITSTAGAKTVSAYGNFKCRAGVGGTETNTFVINWTGSPQLWIDTTNVGTLATVSDYRVKRNIQTQTAPALERVMALRPVTYQMADYGDLFKSSDDIKEGFIAHELQEIIPSGVDGAKDDETQIQSLRVDAILSVAVKAIQEQQTLIEKLTTRLNALEGK